MFIKRILFKILSVEAYLKLVSSLFFISYFLGILRLKRKFDFHYFAAQLIHPGDTVVDIGGNLGYYSIIFARKAGKKGKIIAVEPVTLFRKVFVRNVKWHNWNNNITILPFALGKDDNKKITLGIPSGNKHFRHGLTRVVENEGQKNNDYEFQETMMRPDTLFGKLEKIDYIKCDVEGYEIHIFPEMLTLLTRFQPVIQIETDGENRDKMINMLTAIGYVGHYVIRKKIYRLTGEEKFHTGDLLFIPTNKTEQFSKFMA